MSCDHHQYRAKQAKMKESNFRPPSLSELSAVATAIGAAQFNKPINDWIYFDELMLFIQYKYDWSTRTLNVINIADQLSLFGLGGSGSIANPDQGIMKVRNFGFAAGITGDQNTEINAAHLGTLGMVFKIANPLWEILAKLPDTAISAALTGGGNAFGPMIEMAVTGAAAAKRFVKSMSWSSGGDPLVLDLGGNGIETTALVDSQVHFDLNNDFFSERTGWLSGSDGFLTLDKNLNGVVDDATELFGTYTGSGFADLAAYDLNHDGKIDAADAVYAKLKIWQDLNGDGVSTADELHTLAELGIASISLNSHVIGGTTPQGTTLRAGSTFTRTDGTSSAIYEAVFGNDQTDTIYRGETGQPSWSAAGTIDVKGFGRLTNLAASMANDFDLAELVKTRSAAANDNRILYLKEVA